MQSEIINNNTKIENSFAPDEKMKKKIKNKNYEATKRLNFNERIK